jgi:hypothetical protein
MRPNLNQFAGFPMFYDRPVAPTGKVTQSCTRISTPGKPFYWFVT